MVQSPQRPVCDYEGSDYRTRFWEGQGRSYEDRVERAAIRRLLPPSGSYLIDIGAGFGRLADEYQAFERVVLFDYSRTLLHEAQERLGDDPRFIYVAGDWYHMPFVGGRFDTMVQVRTIHHAADVPALLGQLSRIAAPYGRYVLEFANKRNLKAIFRYLLRRQSWSPFATDPIEFVELNYDFHPGWINQRLTEGGFQPRIRLAVSHFRLNLLKRLVPTKWLVKGDELLQPTGHWLQLTPSVFVASAHPHTNEPAAQDELFACPHCYAPLAETVNDALPCPKCGRAWRVERGVYDFKAPV